MSVKKTKGIATDVDAQFGQRLRAKRTLLGVSQEKLAETIGLTFQQIQKYERGTNRISASRLVDISNALNIPVTYFFDQIADVPYETIPHAFLSDNAQEGFESLPPAKTQNSQEIKELLEFYNAIKHPDDRKEILDFIKTVARRSAKTS